MPFSMSSTTNLLDSATSQVTASRKLFAAQKVTSDMHRLIGSNLSVRGDFMPSRQSQITNAIRTVWGSAT